MHVHGRGARELPARRRRRDGVSLEAADEAGHARALATLRQLGPELPGMVIEDSPRYPWRGVMLDVARHFFGVDDVLRLIDLAALYKLNVVHLHLTDDQGWRIEIPGWPRLTTVGAETQVGGGPGGFFTQDDLRADRRARGDAPHHGRAGDRRARATSTPRYARIRSCGAARRRSRSPPGPRPGTRWPWAPRSSRASSMT